MFIELTIAGDKRKTLFNTNAIWTVVTPWDKATQGCHITFQGEDDNYNVHESYDQVVHLISVLHPVTKAKPK